ncbi:MAG: hypothetical protein ACI9LO_002406 [Planctomycetota bacterium]|jgi:hypothetical protein
MQTLTKILLDHEMDQHLLTDSQLARVIDGSAQRRYSLVNRAIKSGELHRLRRGAYLVTTHYREYKFHPFAIAQHLKPGSYISLETALAHHGWIPEAVYATASVVPGRKSSEFSDGLFGHFSYHPLSLNRGYFLELVSRESVNRKTSLIARPLRALMDLVCLRKLEWQGLDWIEGSLRIDIEVLSAVDSAQLRILQRIYKQKRMQQFMIELGKALDMELRHEA